jgi:hypothetical protein
MPWTLSVCGVKIAKPSVISSKSGDKRLAIAVEKRLFNGVFLVGRLLGVRVRSSTVISLGIEGSGR